MKRTADETILLTNPYDGDPRKRFKEHELQTCTCQLNTLKLYKADEWNLGSLVDDYARCSVRNSIATLKSCLVS